MKLACVLALLPALAFASPIEPRQTVSNSTASAGNSSIVAPVTDVNVLQFALTLELLEYSLYRAGYDQFSQADFEAAGQPDWVKLRFSEILAQEQNHISFISSAIKAAGQTPTQKCTYKFPFYDVKSWLLLSQIVDGVGPNAYLGASGLLQNKKTLTEAVSILSTESRHNAWLRSAVNFGDAFPTAYETALTLNQVYTLAAQFIVSCPSTNPALPAKANPALNITSSGPLTPVHVGDTLKFATKASIPSSGAYAAFFTNNTVLYSPYSSGSAKVPKGAMGQVYVQITRGQNASDATTLAGPMAIEVPVPAKDFLAQTGSYARLA